jgi:hypothetical protein
MAPYIQPVVQKTETTEGLVSTAQFRLLMLSIELLPPLREALDIHAIEERATTHDSASLEGRVRRKFGVLEPRTFSFKDR